MSHILKADHLKETNDLIFFSRVLPLRFIFSISISVINLVQGLSSSHLDYCSSFLNCHFISSLISNRNQIYVLKAQIQPQHPHDLSSQRKTGTVMHCRCECKIVQLLWKIACQFLKKLKINLPYDPGILPLSVFLREMKTYVYANTWM